MKCQHCGISDVNFHYSSNINGVVTERHLCSKCAAELGYTSPRVKTPAGMLDSLFGSSFATPVEFPGAFGFVTPMLFAMQPHMGILIQDECGTSSHRIPSQETKIDDDMQKRREINILREQMRKAAESEDFEKAAELRDKIKKMTADE